MTEPVSPAHGIERFSNKPLTAARGTESVNVIATNAKKVICNLCSNEFSRGGSDEETCNTSNLRKHLQCKHKDELEKEINATKEAVEKSWLKRKGADITMIKFSKMSKAVSSCSNSPEDTMSTQLTLEETLSLKKIWDINSSQAISIHNSVANMIIVDCQPFSIVEDVGFNKLMKCLKPNYELPSRKFFKEKTIPTIHKSVVHKVQTLVNNEYNISFTTVIWTNVSNHSFISVTEHCLDRNFTSSTVVLRVVSFVESHTAANISTLLQGVLNGYNISKHKVLIFVSDNAANITKGIHFAGCQSLPCFLHSLQLVIKDSLHEQRII